jgi:copper chaperone CopZ
MSETSASNTILSVNGMTCNGCVNTVTKVLNRVPGVTGAQVELDAAKATVEGTASAEDLIAAVEAAGFEAARAEA